MSVKRWEKVGRIQSNNWCCVRQSLLWSHSSRWRLVQSRLVCQISNFRCGNISWLIWIWGHWQKVFSAEVWGLWRAFWTGQSSYSENIVTQIWHYATIANPDESLVLGWSHDDTFNFSKLMILTVNPWTCQFSSSWWGNLEFLYRPTIRSNCTKHAESNITRCILRHCVLIKISDWHHCPDIQDMQLQSTRTLWWQNSS